MGRVCIDKKRQYLDLMFHRIICDIMIIIRIEIDYE